MWFDGKQQLLFKRLNEKEKKYRNNGFGYRNVMYSL